MSIKRDVELLFELGTLRNIDRTWKQFLGSNVANLAEHHFRMAWIAIILAKHEGADVGKVLRLAILHDVAESRTGDVNYLSRQYVKRDEEKAVRDIFTGTSLNDEASSLFEEYEKRETLESKVVKDADVLDQDMEIRELENVSNKTVSSWKGHRKDDIRPILYTESAKKFFDEIYNTEPYFWHLNSPSNRYNGGDWQQK